MLLVALVVAPLILYVLVRKAVAHGILDALEMFQGAARERILEDRYRSGHGPDAPTH